MNMAILGIGTALPRHFITQDDAARAALAFCGADSARRRVPSIYRKTDIDRRASVVLDGSSGNGLKQSFYPASLSTIDGGPSTGTRSTRYAAEAAPLALRAARAALQESQTPPGQITHLVTVSCTGFAAPGVDRELIVALGLPPTVLRTHVGFMGCHGALNGLRVAAAFCGATPGARVLLVAVELCSLHYQYGDDAATIVSNALFADGAAALVGAPTLDYSVVAHNGSAPAPPASRAGGNPPAPLTADDSWRVTASGSCLLPDSADAMTWTIGDTGFRMTLSVRVPELIAAHLRPWLESWLANGGLRLDEVGSWAIHPGGPRIISAVAEALALPAAATTVSREVLATCGNMSSPTVLFILDRLRRAAAPRPCVALAFGPGLVAEAALFC